MIRITTEINWFTSISGGSRELGFVTITSLLSKPEIGAVESLPIIRMLYRIKLAGGLHQTNL